MFVQVGAFSSTRRAGSDSSMPRRPPASDPLPLPAAPAMPVRSLRLPQTLWQRLEAARMEVNRGRRRPVSLSTVIRALLERGLAQPGALDLDAKIVRPDRILRERTAKLAAAKSADDARALFRQASDRIDEMQLTPPLFAAAIGGNRREAEAFYYRGELPASEPLEFLKRVQSWLAQDPASGSC